MYVGSHCLVLGCFNDQVIHEQVTVSPSLSLPLSASVAGYCTEGQDAEAV